MLFFRGNFLLKNDSSEVNLFVSGSRLNLISGGGIKKILAKNVIFECFSSAETFFLKNFLQKGIF